MYLESAGRRGMDGMDRQRGRSEVGVERDDNTKAFGEQRYEADQYYTRTTYIETPPESESEISIKKREQRFFVVKIFRTGAAYAAAEVSSSVGPPRSFTQFKMSNSGCNCSGSSLPVVRPIS